MSSEQLEALKEEIWRRAKERAERILKEAEMEAERILEEARKRVEESLRSSLESEKTLLRRRMLGRALSEGRRMLIMAKSEVVEKVFARALEKLRSEAESKSEAYRSFLRRSLEQALDHVSGPDVDEVIVYANESDLDLIASMIENAPVSMRLERASMIGGLNASDAGGQRIYYGSIESRLEALKPILREKIAAMLFRGVGA
ncbi:MAG: V-type ATP synthase subunit E [Nitrososphaerota archaeon]